MTRRPLRAGLLDHRAGDRAPHGTGRHFTGVMNSGFFATADGVQGDRVQRALRRPGVHEHHEPVRGDWPQVMSEIAPARLRAPTCCCAPEASLVLYLVSPDYAARARRSPDRYEFALDRRADRSARAARCSSPRPSRRREHLPHGRNLARGGARDDRADARAGARARRQRLRRRGRRAASGGATSATSATCRRLDAVLVPSVG